MQVNWQWGSTVISILNCFVLCFGLVWFYVCGVFLGLPLTLTNTEKYIYIYNC